MPDVIEREVIVRRGYPSGDPRGRASSREDIYSATAGSRISPQRQRDYCRRASEDNPYAKRAVRVLASQSARYGVTPIFPSSNKRAKKAMDSAYLRWLSQANIDGTCDFNGIQAAVAEEYFAVGEVFVRRHVVPADRAADLGLEVPLQFEIIKSEQVPFESFKAPNGHRVVDGVELDDYGLEVAIWAYAKPRGDTTLVGSQDKVRLPIYRMFGRASVEGEILHIKRPGVGRRGRSDIEAARPKLGSFERYSKATLTRSEVEACFAAFVTESDEQAKANENMPREPGISDEPLGDIEDTEDERLEWIEPGRIDYLKKGQKIDFANPQSSGGLEVFARETLRAISVAIGVPYERLTNDLSKVSYVSFKAGEIQFKADVEMFQWLVLVAQFLAPAMAMWTQVGWLVGKWDRVSPETVNFGMPKWESADPTKDLSALALEMQLGLVSYIQAKAERGEDWQLTMEEIEEVAAQAAEKGLPGFLPAGIAGKAAAGIVDPPPESSDVVESDQDEPEGPKPSGRARRAKR
ncbi:MAG: phage portal protein [Erythrobacter sp.]|nr:phage portal protein [Erythrobacter sp.]